VIFIENPLRIWEIQQNDSWEQEYGLGEDQLLPPILARLLANRGISGEGQQADYLRALEQTPRSPFLMSGMQEAVTLIKATIQSEGKILIYGDYDVDGITATAIMLETLDILGGKHTHFLPSRFVDGYGFSAEKAQKMAESGIELIITVDCGIRDIEAVNIARSAGAKVIITDHHRPGDQLPVCEAVIDPHLDSDLPFRDYSGAGVALKLSHALLGEELAELLDLAALGTISDVVPLIDENRRIAMMGLQQIKSCQRAGLVALCELARINIRKVTSENVSFNLAPRLNSAGRMGHPRLALQCLLVDDYPKAYRVAQGLIATNEKRKKIEGVILEAAVEKVIEKNMPKNGVIVVADEGWHIGVLGIIAARLAERFSVPAIVLKIEGDTCTGSGRSVGSINIFQHISACGDLLLRFGGHAAAAGLTVARELLEDFYLALIAQMKQESSNNYCTPVRVDCVVSPEFITEQLVNELQMLFPTGEGNPAPVFLAPRVEIMDVRLFAKSSHTLCQISSQAGNIEAKYFNNVDMAKQQVSAYDLIYTPQFNDFNGIRRMELKLLAARPILFHGTPNVLKISVRNAGVYRLGSTMRLSDIALLATPDDPIILKLSEQIADQSQYAFRLAWYDNDSAQASIYVFADSGANLLCHGYPKRYGAQSCGNRQDFFSAMQRIIFSGGVPVLLAKNDIIAKQLTNEIKMQKKCAVSFFGSAMDVAEKTDFLMAIAHMKLSPVVTSQAAFENLLAPSCFGKHDICLFTA
jgi:single-stranded-DNA-specific exonuclease